MMPERRSYGRGADPLHQADAVGRVGACGSRESQFMSTLGACVFQAEGQ
jgi:hypothetical protein